MSSIVLIPFAAFALTVTLHMLALWCFPRWGLLDFPKRYGLARHPLPYPTGILAPIVFMAFFLFLEPKNMQLWGLVLGISLLAAVCVIDDRRPLHPMIRLTVQMIAALIIFAKGSRIYTITNPLEGILSFAYIPLDHWTVDVAVVGSLPILSAIFTVFWLGLTMNAMNWFDGIPGQVTLLSTIGFLTIGLLSMSERVNQPSLALLAFVLAGISAASFAFDVPPPRVVLGDTGAMFFGLMLGVLTIYEGGKVATAFLVLGVPLIDSFIVTIRRIRQGHSPLRGSVKGDHLHHRLLACGWSPQQIIALTAGIGTAFGVTALFLGTTEKFVAALCLAILMLGLTRYSRPA